MPAAMSNAGQDVTALTNPPPLRILIVDDDPAMVGAITALVGAEGHQVITAYDGLAAVKRFREEQPDLVLLDLVMSGCACPEYSTRPHPDRVPVA